MVVCLIGTISFTYQRKHPAFTDEWMLGANLMECISINYEPEILLKQEDGFTVVIVIQLN